MDVARVVSHQITWTWLSIVLSWHCYCTLLCFQTSTTRLAALTSCFPIADLAVNWARLNLTVFDLDSVTLDWLPTISGFNLDNTLA
jgi:hypothetical protein